MDFIIRDIQRGDIDSILNLLEEYRLYYNFNQEYYGQRDLLKDAFSDTNYLKIFVALIKEDVVGFILFNQSFDLNGRSIFIEDNFVSEKFRGNKIGSSLFSKVLDYSFENKVDIIKWNISEKEKHLLPFYIEMGANLIQDKETFSLLKEDMVAISEKEMDFNSDLFKIRNVTNRDLPEIKYFIEEEIAKKKESITVDIYDLMKYSLGTNQLFKIFLLEVQDEIVGLITFFDYFSAFYGKAAHIQNTFVKEDYKSIGISRILNTYVIHRLTKNKYNYLTIDVDKDDLEANSRMQFLNAKPIVDNTVVEMDKNSLRELIKNT